MARYLAVGKESAFGQEAISYRYIDIASEDIRTEHEWIMPELAGYRWKRYAMKGTMRVGGSVDAYAQFGSLGIFLLAVLGSVSTGQPDPDGAPSVFKHEFTPGDTLPSYTLRVVSEITGRQFLGCVCSSLELSVAPGELLGVSTEWVGQREEAFTPGAPEWDESPYVSFADLASAEVGGSPVSLEALTLTIENDLADDAFELGSAYLPEIPVQALSITGSFDLKFKDRTHLDRFLSGEETSLYLRFEGPEIEGGLRYSLELDLPRIIYKTAGANVSGRDRLVESVEFEALFDPVEGRILRAVLQNQEAGY